MTLEEMRHLDAVKTYKELEEAKAEIERLRKANFQLREGAEEQKQRIKRLDEENLRMLDYIKQLDEGGDRAIINSYFPDRLTIWAKAKEAKP